MRSLRSVVDAATDQGRCVRMQVPASELVAVSPFPWRLVLVEREAERMELVGGTDAGSASSWRPVIVFNDYRIAMIFPTPFLKRLGGKGSPFDLVTARCKNDEGGKVAARYSGFKLS